MMDALTRNKTGNDLSEYLRGTAPARARNTDPVTSHQAADRVNVTRREGEVLDALKSNVFGMTINDIADYMGRSLVAVSPRLKPLVLKGLVEDTGLRRAGPEGRARIVWRAK